ncbi:MAG: hypothetical protein WCP87_06835, partial [Atribacterota bacterium]
MEKEPGRPVTLTDFFQENMAQLDHWDYDDSSFTHTDMTPGSALLSDFREVNSVRELSSWKKRGEQGPMEKMYFVDGKMRVYGRILLGMDVLLLAEITAGHVLWEKGRGLSMGFSPHHPPLRERVLGASERAALSLQTSVQDPALCIGQGWSFTLATSGRTPPIPGAVEASQQALFTAMQKLEKKVVSQLITKNTPVIQDGTVHGSDPTFRPGVGPCGLVKRIENLRLSGDETSLAEETVALSRSLYALLFELEAGERTPFLSASFEAGSHLARVFTYTRLIRKDPYHPLKGLIRLEIVVPEETDSLREEITLFFDRMVALLPTLTADYPWRRLPENIFPIIALEDFLGQFFLPPDLV